MNSKPSRPLNPFPPIPRLTRQPSTQKPGPKPLSPQKRPINKSAQPKRKRKILIQVKTKYKISSDHLGFLIQQQKISDLNIIRSSIALNYYYEALLSLFGVIYSSSQIIVANMFEEKKMSTGLSGVKFVGVLFSLYQFVWNQRNIGKLKTMAKNVMKMGSTVSIFSQKMQFICRKITLNYNMQSRIQMSFLNPYLQSFWQQLLRKFKFTDQIQLLQTMYESAPQKMAYWDFNYFVNNYLANQEFYDTLKNSNKFRRIQNTEEDTLPHNFTYQFVVVQIFCFMNRDQDQEEQCQIRLGGKGRICQKGKYGGKDQKNCQII